MLKTSLLAVFSLLAQQGTAPADCALIEPDDKRLSCYDAHFRGHAVKVQSAEDASQEERAPLAAGSPADGSRTPGRVVEAEPRAPAAGARVRAPEEEFGLSAAQVVERERADSPTPELDQLEARVASLERTGAGHFVLTLDNGQRWIEVAPSQRVRFRAGEPVTIRRAALGSFLARGPNSGGGVRVRRMD
jgi:hypothetical protein